MTESRPGGADRTAQTIAVCLPGCVPATTSGPTPSGAKPDLVIDSVMYSDVGDHCDIAVQVGNPGTGPVVPDGHARRDRRQPGSRHPDAEHRRRGNPGGWRVGRQLMRRAARTRSPLTASNAADELTETNNVGVGRVLMARCASSRSRRPSVEWRDRPTPVLAGDGEALVRPLAVALCDLDAAFLTGVIESPTRSRSGMSASPRCWTSAPR